MINYKDKIDELDNKVKTLEKEIHKFRHIFTEYELKPLIRLSRNSYKVHGSSVYRYAVKDSVLANRARNYQWEIDTTLDEGDLGFVLIPRENSKKGTGEN